MLDTLTIAHRLTDAGLPAAHADAIAGAVREAAEAGGAVTPEMLRAEVATVRTEVATVRADIYRAMLIQGGAIVAAVVGLQRVLG